MNEHFVGGTGLEGVADPLARLLEELHDVLARAVQEGQNFVLELVLKALTDV